MSTHRPQSQADELRRRIVALRVTIAAAERKQRGIHEAITSRRLTVQRLLAQLALCESGEVSFPNATCRS